MISQRWRYNGRGSLIIRLLTSSSVKCPAARVILAIFSPSLLARSPPLFYHSMRFSIKQQLLECCHFELDRRGHIIDYQPRCHCCETAACCSDEQLMPTRSRQGASFLQSPRLSEQN